ncbi:Guanylyl cyclase-activating protein 1 [Anabarilius grahami]|uniref:Guanylyl cyclase-activating protein 1 n=1 Tax=Anabarilius grahami TaxID=495550 RepID=A0A3N0YUQ9_ANAGA|nr:Guanylyl cyclase-activating protein 1 [Anabarilius grahami]
MGAHGSSLDEVLAEDMHHWYNKFMRESPSGLITLFELKAMLQMQGMTEEASSFVDQVFFTFDMDGDGYIDFVEYIAAVSLLLKGEINQKLKWYFKLFDQDGNGKIDRDEMETIFKAIQDITRSYDIPPDDIVTLIYEKIDVNNEGESPVVTDDCHLRTWIIIRHQNDTFNYSSYCEKNNPLQQHCMP